MSHFCFILISHPRVFIALHLPVAYVDITRQLEDDNNNYKFSACPYSILQEFAVENEVTTTSHPDIKRELHNLCTNFPKILKRFVFITDELDVPWDHGTKSAFRRDDLPLVATCALLKLS